MNLFLLALARTPIEREVVGRPLRAVASQLPYFDGAETGEHASAEHRLVASWVAHAPERVGGITYAARKDGALALFSGRPILATAAGFDGAAPLDASLYLRPRGEWELRLDGRYVVVVCDGSGQVAVTTDRVGAYRVFTAERDGVRWIGNNAHAVGLAAGATGFDELALASLLTFGWCFGGQPLRAGVQRLGPNATHTFAADGTRWTTAHRPDLIATSANAFDPRRAAQVLSGTTAAFMDWPARPPAVSVTGGRDSRLTFAAAVQAGRPLYAKTSTRPDEAGFPESADVVVARRLCEIAGVEHHTEIATQDSDIEHTGQALAVMSAGSITAGNVGTVPTGLAPGPLELHVTGQGGEIARSYYGAEFASPRQAGEEVCKHHIHRMPAPIVNDSAVELVRRWVREWADARAEQGIPVAALGDAFYFEERMGGWAAAGHGTYEYWADTVCPLWTASLTPLMLACPAHLRRRDGFHNLVLREISRELWAVKFAGVSPNWPSLRARQMTPEPLTKAARRVRLLDAEIRRRLELRRRRGGAGHVDLIVDAQRRARELVGAFPDHDAWNVLDRDRVEHVLSADPRAMHPRNRDQIWRVLAAFEEPPLRLGSGTPAH